MSNNLYSYNYRNILTTLNAYGVLLEAGDEVKNIWLQGSLDELYSSYTGFVIGIGKGTYSATTYPLTKELYDADGGEHTPDDNAILIFDHVFGSYYKSYNVTDNTQEYIVNPTTDILNLIEEFCKAVALGTITLKYKINPSVATSRENIYNTLIQDTEHPWSKIVDDVINNIYSDSRYSGLYRDVTVMQWIFEHYNAFVLRLRVNPDKFNTYYTEHPEIGETISINTADLLIWPTYGNIVTKYYNHKTHDLVDEQPSNMYEWEEVKFYDFNPDVTVRDIDVGISESNIDVVDVRMYDLNNNLISYCVQGANVSPGTRPNRHYIWKGYGDYSSSEHVCNRTTPLKSNYDYLMDNGKPIIWILNTPDTQLHDEGFTATKSLLIKKIYIATVWNVDNEILFNTLNSLGAIEQERLIWNSGIATETQTKTVTINSGMKTIYQAGNDVSLVGDNTAITDKSVSGGTKNSIYGSVTIPTLTDDEMNAIYNGTADLTDTLNSKGVTPVSTKSTTNDNTASPVNTGSTKLPTDTTAGTLIANVPSRWIPSVVFSGGNGFTSSYLASAADMANLSNVLWSQDFATNILKLFTSPMEAIINVGYVPVNPYFIGTIGHNVKLGGFNTGITLPKLQSNVVTINCGIIQPKLDISPSFMKYSPYTRIELFLPFIGMVNIDPNDNHYNGNSLSELTIEVQYRIDLLTGSCVAEVFIDNMTGQVPLYSFTGNCMRQIPITSSNYGQLYTSIIKTVVDTGMTVATGGATAGSLIGDIGSMATSIGPDIQKSGGLGGNTGFLSSSLKPYLVVRQAIPYDYNDYGSTNGYIDRRYSKVSYLYNGFYIANKFRYVNNGTDSPTLDEIEEIGRLFSEGVYL